MMMYWEEDKTRGYDSKWLDSSIGLEFRKVRGEVSCQLNPDW